MTGLEEWSKGGAGGYGRGICQGSRAEPGVSPPAEKRRMATHITDRLGSTGCVVRIVYRASAEAVKCVHVATNAGIARMFP